MYVTKKKGLFSALILCLSVAVYAQSGYRPLSKGLAYKMLYDKKSGVSPGIGDYVEAHMYLYVDGKNIYNSRTAGQGQPVTFVLQEGAGADIQEAIMKMTAGDSISVLIPVDSMLAAGSQQYEWMRPNTGQKAEYLVKLLKVKPLNKK